MKKKVCFKVNPPYRKNKLFEKGRDLDLYYWLKVIFESNDYEVGTNDIIKEDQSQIVFYLDYRTDYLNSDSFKVLMAMESNAVIKKTFENFYLNKFDLVFTFLDDIVNNKNILKNNYSFNLTKEVGIPFKEKTNFLCNFSSNKFSNHKNELYSKRVQAIEFYEKKSDTNFDLYGYGWNKSFLYPKIYNVFKTLHNYRILRVITRLVNLIPNKINPFQKRYKCYQGPVFDKYKFLKKYKFSLCYENVRNVNGYVTEKIFDCFKNQVVPIYWGPENIEDIIPKESFINRSKYSSDKEVYELLISIDEFQYNQMIDAGTKFLNSEKAIFFDSYKNAENIFNKIIIASNEN